MCILGSDNSLSQDNRSLRVLVSSMSHNLPSPARLAGTFVLIDSGKGVAVPPSCSPRSSSSRLPLGISSVMMYTGSPNEATA